ncbi:MAG: penicillin-binding protein 2 [Geminicoccaceae bacterium]
MQNPEADRKKVFNRRALILGGAQLGVFGLLASRLHYLQVTDAERYALLAEENRVNHRLLMPARGRILDRRGTPIAHNRSTYRIHVIREHAKPLDAILDRLAELIIVDEERRAEILAQARVRHGFVPVLVRENLSWEEVARVAVHAPDLPGVVLDSGLLRHYPYGEMLAHLVGYVGPVSEEERAADDDPLMRMADLRIGKSGIEKSYDGELRGGAGSFQLEVNALGREIREIDREEGEPGADLALTVDLELQSFCHRRLSTELSATAVVMDVDTGAVLALTSVPSFQPEAFSSGLPRSLWNAWRTDPRAPLVNKAIRGQYPPGSTFKMITALAGLEAGVIDPKTEFDCTGVMRIGSWPFHCWKEKGHRRIAVVQALAQSCDVFFYQVADQVGVDQIAAMAKRFGLGQSLGLDLPGERGGLVPTQAWKREQLGERWHRGETLNIGIGQGFLLSTPLQLAVMTARIANGGFAITPHLVQRTEENAPPPPVGVSEDSLALIKEGMFEVVNGGRGTARAHKLLSDGVQMAGKTGTSQVRRISSADRASGAHKRKDRPWEERHHALFVAFAPFDRPRYAVAVVVEHGHSGSKAAAPIARDIMDRVLELDPASGRLGPVAQAPGEGPG